MASIGYSLWSLVETKNVDFFLLIIFVSFFEVTTFLNYVFLYKTVTLYETYLTITFSPLLKWIIKDRIFYYNEIKLFKVDEATRYIPSVTIELNNSKKKTYYYIGVRKKSIASIIEELNKFNVKAKF